jgi:hypothetical protein
MLQGLVIRISLPLQVCPVPLALNCYIYLGTKTVAASTLCFCLRVCTRFLFPLRLGSLISLSLSFLFRLLHRQLLPKRGRLLLGLKSTCLKGRAHHLGRRSQRNALPTIVSQTLSQRRMMAQRRAMAQRRTISQRRDITVTRRNMMIA